LKNNGLQLYSLLVGEFLKSYREWANLDLDATEPMSTRAQIDIISSTGELTKVYVHCDGGFNCLGNTLHNLLTMANANNSERLIWLLERLIGDTMRITDRNGGDIEYYYVMDYKRNSFYAWKVLFDDKGIWKNGKCNVCDYKINLIGDELNYG